MAVNSMHKILYIAAPNHEKKQQEQSRIIWLRSTLQKEIQMWPRSGKTRFPYTNNSKFLFCPKNSSKLAIIDEGNG